MRNSNWDGHVLCLTSLSLSVLQTIFFLCLRKFFGPLFTPVQQDGDDEGLVQPVSGGEADVSAVPY